MLAVDKLMRLSALDAKFALAYLVSKARRNIDDLAVDNNQIKATTASSKRAGGKDKIVSHSSTPFLCCPGKRQGFLFFVLVRRVEHK